MSKQRIFRFIKWFFGILLGFVVLISLLLFIFKDEICGLVVHEVNKQLKSKVIVGEVDLSFWGSFPNLSVDFNEVFIKDSYVGATELDTLLYSDRIRLKFNPMDIWRENYTVHTVEVYPGTLKLKVNDEGLHNFDILKDKSDSVEAGGFNLSLEDVELDNFHFSYINEATNQEYRTLLKSMYLKGAFHSSQYTASATSELDILSARSGNITLVSNKPASLNISVDVNNDSNTVIIPQSKIYISGLPFNFNGMVHQDGFNFNLKGNNIRIQDAANSLAMQATNSVNQFSGQGILLFDLNIDGTNDPVQPVSVNCAFGIKNATLRDPKSSIKLSKLKLDGAYTNKGGHSKEKLELKNISFSTRGGPFAGDLLLTNFKNPIFKGNANGVLDLAVLNSFLGFRQIETIDGKVELRTNFIVQGKANRAQQLDYHINKCEGQLQLHDINLKLIEDKRLFKSVNGLLYLRNNEAGLENIVLKIGDSDFQLNGIFTELVDYFSGQGNLTANVAVKSENINLSDLGTDTKEEKRQRERQYILPNNIDGTLHLEVGTLKYDNHSFDRIKGNMSVSGRTIHFPRIAVQNGGADVVGSLTIEERTPEIFFISSQVVSKNINFKKLFNEWDNFKQDVIKSENIRGIAQANFVFEAPFDMRSGVISKAIIAQVGIQIDNGRLLKVPIFDTITASLKSSAIRHILGKKNIDAFGIKLRDLKFERLKNTLVIKDGVITIPAMSIHSSALQIQASGKHTFDNKVDYRFGFNLRELRQKKEVEFGEIVDDGTGIEIFVHMFGDLNNPTIKWDKMSRKEKTKAYNEAEKQNTKSMLKAEFGLFKNDTTVQEYIQSTSPKEEMIIHFDPVNSIDTLIEVKQPKKKDTKINRLLQKWKKESDTEKQDDFEIDDGSPP